MLKELIDEFYQSKKDSKEKTAFYATDAGKCPRAIYFALKKYPKKDYDAKILRIFEHGNHTHMRIVGVLFSLGLINAVEVDLPEKDLIHGRADVIISIKGEPYVVEIKSVNSFKFKKGEPDSDHIKQLQLYLHFFKIKKGILLYENKDNQDLMEYVIEYDEKLALKLIDSFSHLKEKVENNTVPEIPSDLEDWRCEYCPYLESCEKVEEKEKDI